MFGEYKEYLENLVTKVKDNGPDHSVRLTTREDGYIFEVFSNTAFDGLAESLFLVAEKEGITISLEDNLCAQEFSIKRFLLKDFNNSAQAVIQETEKLVKGYMPGLNL